MENAIVVVVDVVVFDVNDDVIDVIFNNAASFRSEFNGFHVYEEFNRYSFLIKPRSESSFGDIRIT